MGGSSGYMNKIVNSILSNQPSMEMVKASYNFRSKLATLHSSTAAACTTDNLLFFNIQQPTLARLVLFSDVSETTSFYPSAVKWSFTIAENFVVPLSVGNSAFNFKICWAGRGEERTLKHGTDGAQRKRVCSQHKAAPVWPRPAMRLEFQLRLVSNAHVHNIFPF